MKNYIPVNFDEIESLVHQKLIDIGHPERSDGWTYRKGGVETGATWKRAKKIYESIGLRQRSIHTLHYDSLDVTTSCCSQKVKLPISIAPMIAGINFICPKPFEQIAFVASEKQILAGIGYPSGVATYSSMVAKDASIFRIVKPLPDVSKLIKELQQGIASGCCATGVDIDSIGGMKPVGDELRFAELARPYGKEELKKVRDALTGHFILKGIMSVEDALDAVEIGADSIIISTHVGYSLDYSLSPLEILPEIKKAVGNKVEIIIDSGITRGTDIIKAVALGADSVLIGRLAIWGLLLNSSEGLSHMIDRLEAELRRSMLLMGVASLKKLSPVHLVALDNFGERILSKMNQ